MLGVGASSEGQQVGPFAQPLYSSPQPATEWLLLPARGACQPLSAPAVPLPPQTMVLSGVAGLVAGALSMAVGEYISVASQVGAAASCWL